ncbi:Trp biosynthesis-associated membrane protein [Microbacterium sp. 179-B 1A2 NHS]|uniref:Trp biosynthesis-associated membrane protein n=1 Tax=Microbacterium sp. 179-B 1A2 NHS TaxID=3142383 RepID=UPI0039A23328
MTTGVSRARRLRTIAVLAVMAGGAIGIIGSTQPWLDVTLRDGAQLALAVPGASALPVLAPLSLAALALGLALTIVGRVLRYAFAALGLALSLGLGVGAFRIAATRPVDAVAAEVTDATGLSGLDGIGGIVTSVSATPWPAVTGAASVLILAGSLLVLATAHRWPGSGRKYRQDAPPARAADGPRDAIDSWDGLSRGEDPTR